MVETEDGCSLAVRVHPGAKKDAIVGEYAGALKVSIAAPPADGRANEGLLRFLAKTLGLKRTQVSLLSGAASRSKVVAVHGCTPAEVLEKLRSASLD